jgi:hypothetical protein
MELARCPEMWVSYHTITRCHNPEDRDLNLSWIADILHGMFTERHLLGKGMSTSKQSRNFVVYSQMESVFSRGPINFTASILDGEPG